MCLGCVSRAGSRSHTSHGSQSRGTLVGVFSFATAGERPWGKGRACIGFVLLASCTLSAGAGPEVSLDRPAQARHVSKQFEKVLGQRLSASWQNIRLRDILRRVEADREIAILLDRRIDPDRLLEIDLNDLPVLAGLEKIAERVSARVSVVGNVVYIGPPESAAKLRTLVRLRSVELFGESAEVPKRRQFALARRRTVHWNDLDRPADLVGQIAQQYGLDVEGLPQVPHDLWAGATLPDADAFEALSLVLIQFDLTFAWTAQAGGIRIIPAPNETFIEQTYTPRGMSAPEAIKRWQQEIPNLAAEPQGLRVLVRGTVEQLEAVEALLRPRRKPGDEPMTSAPTPLGRRLFTLKTQGVPAAAMMDTLAQSGIVFQYSAPELKTAGIDLNKPINMNATKATADEFFRAMFDPLGLKFTIDGLTVTLTPK